MIIMEIVEIMRAVGAYERGEGAPVLLGLGYTDSICVD